MGSEQTMNRPPWRPQWRRSGRGIRSSVLVLGLALVLLGGSVACGSKSDSSNEATASTTTVPIATTAPTTASTVAPTTTASPTVQEPSCDEVQALIAQMSRSDVAALKKWQILFFSRLAASGEGWRILTQPTNSSPSGAVYYDWTPATGLGPPVGVSAEEAKALRNASLMLITMRCATPMMPPDLSSGDWVPVNP